MFSRYSNTPRLLAKTLLLYSNEDNSCCKLVISELQQTRAPRSSFFHANYTYASFDEEIINIYTLESSLKSPPGLINSVDLTVHILDYERDPHSWIDTLSKRAPESQRTLVIVYNREKASYDMDQETHEYIQLTLRAICLREGYSLMYSSDCAKIAQVVKQMLLSHGQPEFSPKDYRELFFFQGTDSWTKIAGVGGGLTAEDLEDACGEWRVVGFGDYANKVSPKAIPDKAASTNSVIRESVPFGEFLASLA